MDVDFLDLGYIQIEFRSGKLYKIYDFEVKKDLELTKEEKKILSSKSHNIELNEKSYKLDVDSNTSTFKDNKLVEKLIYNEV